MKTQTLLYEFSVDLRPDQNPEALLVWLRSCAETFGVRLIGNYRPLNPNSQTAAADLDEAVAA